MTYEELQTEVQQLEIITQNGDFILGVTKAKELLGYFLAVDSGGKEELHCYLLLTLSESLWRRGMATEALPHSLKAVELAEKANNKKLQAKGWNNLAGLYWNLSNYRNALKYFNKTLVLVEELEDESAIASVTGNIGLVYWNLSDYSQALEYSAKSLSIDEKIGNQAGIASTFCNIGLVYVDMADFQTALEYYLKSLEIDEKLENKGSLAGTLCNIGIVYNELADYKNANEYYYKALAFAEETDNKQFTANILGNIGLVYQSLSDFSFALEYLYKSLAINEKIGNYAGVARDKGNIAGVCYELSDYARALEYYFESVAMSDEVGDKQSSANNIGNIGSVYATPSFKEYNVEKAEEFVYKAIIMNESLGTKNNLLANHKILATLYEQEQRWKESQYHFKQYHELYVEVQSEGATKQAQLMEHRRKIQESERDRQVKLARFQEQEKILHNILPSQIADRMIEGEKTIVDSYDSVSVLFADIVGFTKLSQRVTPEQLVAGLDGIFNTFDLLADKYGCEKIKTIGDCYMVVAGLPERCDDHAKRLGAMALEMQKAIEELPVLVENISIAMRIGIHSGSVVAGIIGKNKYAYDLWGDAVNTASRMESHGEAGKIHVSEKFRTALISTATNELPIRFIPRGEIDIKGKGKMKTYFMEKA
ncbi:MAG: tetratricopeptide repeat protein [Bacteroidetes bacterium]|nr:tetratricopeptide repeat protein [Bacteroidota bacterium]